MGMLATEINGLALKEFLERIGIPCVQNSALLTRGLDRSCGEMRHSMDKGNVIIFSGGTGLPYFTTDTGAVLRALEVGARTILKASTADGIYDDDPKVNANAKRFDRLTYDDAICRQLAVLDGEAFCLCRTHGINLIVFDMHRPNALVEVVQGKNIGTFISNGNDGK
jgi:uridylate kinase